MTVTAWRLVKAKYAPTAFSGLGAKDAGGRWNSPGVPVIYASGSASLAILELLAHIEAEDLLERYVLFEVSFPHALMTAVTASDLPKTWRRSPPTVVTQRLGDDWVVRGKSAVLRVPGVLVPTEWNCLLSPAHPDFPKITIGPKRPVHFDPRLMKSTRN
jgi:RES domain-containing protein